jgi:hypothetical protein
VAEAKLLSRQSKFDFENEILGINLIFIIMETRGRFLEV